MKTTLAADTLVFVVQMENSECAFVAVLKCLKKMIYGGTILKKKYQLMNGVLFIGV